MSSLEKQMIAMINESRAREGLPSLAANAKLREGALAHSQDMSANNFFSHTSPTRGGFSTRLKAINLQTAGAGENIALFGTITKADAALLGSAPHRANIMSKTYNSVGIGIVWNKQKGAYYITQWFAKLG